ALAHRGDEIAHDRQRDIGFEQGDADLAQRRRDVVLAERAAAPQPVEDVVEPIAQTVEHCELSPQHRRTGARNSRTGRLPEKWGWGGGFDTPAEKARGRYRPARFLSINGRATTGRQSAAAEQPFDVAERQAHIGRAAMIALAAVWRCLHLTQ